MQSNRKDGLRSQIGALHFGRFLGVLMLSMVLSSHAIAADPAANIVTRIFMDACIPNMGKPEQIRAWAASKHLPPITADAALALFVGPGTHGDAWAVPSDAGNFALSIRGTTEGCAVWARTADPGEVETLYKKVIEGIKRPGIDITPAGKARSLVYLVKAQGTPVGFVFTMLTAEHPGNAFQASLQVAESNEKSMK
jgi:hypothetical protein